MAIYKRAFKLHQSGMKVKDIAKELNSTARSISAMVSLERKRLGLPPVVRKKSIVCKKNKSRRIEVNRKATLKRLRKNLVPYAGHPDVKYQDRPRSIGELANTIVRRLAK